MVGRKKIGNRKARAVIVQATILSITLSRVFLGVGESCMVSF